jgi:hypothetical protein
LNFEKYSLPDETWEWIGEWTIESSDDVDEEGWGYALEFSKPYHKKQQTFDYVRRRKWIRICRKL